MSASDDQSPPPPAPPTAAGFAATRWLPCGRLGSGSFGHVSLALNLLDNSLFAIKSCTPSSAASLLNELHILQSLHSPFIVRCLGARFDSSSLLRSLFLEYMDGGSLADLIRRSGGKLTNEATVACYTRSILQGLDYLHHNGVVHCDIKSHNILIGSSGVKIGDFGAARRMESRESSSCTDKSMLRGTPLYMAPEVVQGVEQGPPSDIWSLGCTVVEMLQGRPPWAHISNLAALFLKLGGSDESAPLSDLISSKARDFVQLCLQRDPKARPTAAELLQHPFLGGEVSEIGQYMQQEKADEQESGSPRSIMGFLRSYEWEDECCVGGRSDQAMPFTASSKMSSPSSKCSSSNAEGWITVKGAAHAKQASQLLQEEGMWVQRKGSEVNLDCAAFLLRNRRRRTVG